MICVPSPPQHGEKLAISSTECKTAWIRYDWKPMNTIGPGVREIRIRDKHGAFRVIYVAKFQSAVYLLHCFQKKTRATSKADLNLAESRSRDLVEELNS